MAKGGGLALVLLFVIFGLLVQVMRWFRPKADQLLDILLNNLKLVPEQLRAQERRDETMLAALNAQNVLLQQISERLASNAERVNLVANNMAQLAGNVSELERRVARQEE